jgi:hypothetical protein
MAETPLFRGCDGHIDRQQQYQVFAKNSWEQILPALMAFDHRKVLCLLIG